MLNKIDEVLIAPCLTLAQIFQLQENLHQNLNTFYIVFCMDLYRKTELSNLILTTSDVSKNVNLYKILKSNLGYKELGHIKTSLNYLYQLQKDVFAMIRQLGPPYFFVTFTSVNNWPYSCKIIKRFYILNNVQILIQKIKIYQT
jgi:hypothetical protein